MVVPLVEGGAGIAEVAVPLIMSGRADLLDLGADVNDNLIGNVCLRLLACKQLPWCLQSFSSPYSFIADSSLGLFFGVAEVVVPFIMSGRTDLLDLGADVNDTLVGDLRLRLLACKQLPCCL